jgi:hypothetical protein
MLVDEADFQFNGFIACCRKRYCLFKGLTGMV